MEKRTLIMGGYDTASHNWTLSKCKITKAAQVQTLVNVPGRIAPLDFSTALTDGQPYYGTASLAATLECSEGNRDSRQSLINTLVNYVDGRRLNIVHPDHPEHYLSGRIQARQEYSDLAHCAVSISAVCDPWLYEAEETIVTLSATTTAKEVSISIHGRMAVVPVVTVASAVTITFNGSTWSLSKGEHILPDLYLTPSEVPGEPRIHKLTYTATGNVTLTYREAVLAV